MSETIHESFNVKMSMLSLTEIDLSTNNLIDIEKTLLEKADIAADFLTNSPVVINLKQLPESELDVDFKTLKLKYI